MASNKDYSNGIASRDVVQAWQEFQKSEDVSISFQIVLTSHKGAPDLLVIGQAARHASVDGEASVLASASATCSGSGLRSLTAVLFHLLYVLDFQLAANEYVKEE